MNYLTYILSASLLSACASVAQAGDTIIIPTGKPTAGNNGDWCSWLKNSPGLLHQDKNNPSIQKVKIAGRLHWQYAHVDGKASAPEGSENFHYDTEEIRRLRLETSIQFFHHLSLDVSVDLEDDTAPLGMESDHDVQYAGIYSATLTFDAASAFQLTTVDALKISVGKHKVSGNAEMDISSKKIKTVERSAISNYLTPPSSTGLVLALKKNDWNLKLGIFSGDVEPEFSEFDPSNSYFYSLYLGRDFNNPCYFDDARLELRLIVNNDDIKNATTNPESKGAYNLDWASSLAFIAQKGRLALLTDLMYGENGDDFSSSGKRQPAREGSFWAVVVLPTYWIVEERLEAVARYQYAHASSSEGIRLNSRYTRRAGGVKDISSLNNGRGDEHHSAYLGLNYYLCGDRSKVMLGLEYDHLNSDGENVYQGYTAWAAFRFYF